MGMFKLGFLRGVSDQYLRTKQAEAEQAAAIAAEERAQERQKELLDIQAENARLAAGRQQYWNEVNERNSQMFQTALNEQNLEQQRILLQERLQLEQEMKTQAREDALVNTFGYIAEEGPQKGKFVGASYKGKKRLPDATEIAPELQRRISKGIPTLLPNELGTIPGIDNIIKQNASVSLGTSAVTAGTLGADPDFNSGYFVLPSKDAEGNPTQKFVRIPAVKESTDVKSKSRSNALLVMTTLSEYEDILPQIISEYSRGEYDNYNTLLNALKKNGGDALRESMKVAETEGKDTVIQNPIDFYGLMTNVKGKANQEWFAKNVIGPVFGYSMDTLKTLMGDPAEISYTYDQVNNRIIRPDPSQWQWATVWDEEAGRNVIRQDVWKQVQDISQYNGLPAQIVLGLVKDHKKPLLALKDIAETRSQLQANVYASGGVMQVTQDAKDLINQKLEKNNFETMEDEILYVRSLIKDDPASRPSSVAVSATGDIVPKFNNRKKLYQINGEDARQMADSARRAQVIAGRMLELRENKLGGVGLPALFRRLAGGGQNIAEALLYLGESYSMEPAVAARYAENAKELQKFAGIDNIDVTSIQGQKLFDLLGEQLAFALAAANQGGEGGRAISDRDVEAQRAVLGLQGLLASDAGLETNLKYIQEQMGLSAAINDQYSKAIDSEDFLAVYIYDQSQNRSRTLDALLEGAPKKFKKVDDPSNITPETHPDMFVKLPDGRTIRKAK